MSPGEGDVAPSGCISVTDIAPPDTSTFISASMTSSHPAECPRAARYGACDQMRWAALRMIRNDGRKDRVDVDRPIGEALVLQIACQRDERAAVGIDAVTERVAAEEIVDFVDVMRKPRQGIAHRAAEAHLTIGQLLCLDKCLVEARRNPAMTLVEVLAN